MERLPQVAAQVRVPVRFIVPEFDVLLLFLLEWRLLSQSFFVPASYLLAIRWSFQGCEESWQYLQRATPNQHNIAADLDRLDDFGRAL